MLHALLGRDSDDVTPQHKLHSRAHNAPLMLKACVAVPMQKRAAYARLNACNDSTPRACSTASASSLSHLKPHVGRHLTTILEQ